MAHSNPTVPSWVPRVSAGITVGVVGSVVLGAPAWLAALLVPDFVAKALDRPDLAPLTRGAAWLVGPHLSEAARRHRTEWPPKRFASRLGLGMVVAIIVASLVWPASVIEPALAAALVLLSGLEAFAGFCVGCRIYSVLSHFNLVQGCTNDACEVVERAS